jgi:hypothetical protein
MKGQSDFIFIPKSYFEKMLQIVPEFAHVFLEKAIPSMLECHFKEEFTAVRLCTTWDADRNNPVKWIDLCNQTDIIHPVKLANYRLKRKFGD